MKLGYGGTKEEMQRLIDKANELREEQGKTSDLSIDSFADIVEAIHTVQDELEITGTTADEANATFSGSFGAMKAAVQDLMGYMALGMDISDALANVIETARVFLFDNCLPMIGRFLVQVPGALVSALTTSIPVLMEQGTEMLLSIADGAKEGIPSLAEKAMEAVSELVTVFLENLPEFIDAGIKAAVSIGEGLIEAAPVIIEKVKELITMIGDSLAEEFPQLEGVFSNLLPIVESVGVAFTGWKLAPTVGTILKNVGTLKTSIGAFFRFTQNGNGILDSLFGSLVMNDGAFSGFSYSVLKAGGGVEGLKKVIGAFISGPAIALVAAVTAAVGAFYTLWTTNEDFRNACIEIWDSVVAKFQEFFQGIVERVNDLGFSFSSFTEMMSAVWQGFCDFMAPIFIGAWEIIANTFTTTLDMITGLLDFFIGLFTGNWDQMWEGVKTVFCAVWDSFAGTVSAAWDAIVGALDVILGWFGTSWQQLWDDTKAFFTDTWDAICSWATNTWNAISATANSIWSGVSTFFTGTLTGISDFFTNTWNNITNFLSTTWGNIKSSASEMWENVKQAIMGPINTAKEGVSKAIDAIKGFFNFTISWPHIPMPHFSISPPGWSFGDLLRGSIPSLGIEWYAKGGVLTDPAIFGVNGNSLMAGGEAGPEAIAPISILMDYIETAVGRAFESAVIQGPETVEGPEFDYEKLADVLTEAISKLPGKSIYLNKKLLGRELADDIDRELARKGVVFG